MQKALFVGLSLTHDPGLGISICLREHFLKNASSVLSMQVADEVCSTEVSHGDHSMQPGQHLFKGLSD